MTRSLLFQATSFAAAMTFCAAVSLPCRADPAAANATANADDLARARALFRQGIDAFHAGKNQEAADALSGAWAIRQTYDVAASLAQAEMALKRYRDAAEHLDFCVSHLSPAENEQTVQQIKAALADMKTHVATLRVSVDHDGAELQVDRRALGVSPLHAPAFVDPGVHTLEARLGGDKVSQIVHVQAGQEYPIALKLGAAATAPSPGPNTSSPTTAEDRNMVPVIVGGVVALAGIAGFIIFDSAASSDTDKRERLRAQNGAYGCGDGTAFVSDCVAELQAAQSHDKNRNLAVASAVVGAAGLISIPVYWFWPRDDDGATSAAQSPRVRLRGAVGVGRISIFGEF